MKLFVSFAVLAAAEEVSQDADHYLVRRNLRDHLFNAALVQLHCVLDHEGNDLLLLNEESSLCKNSFDPFNLSPLEGISNDERTLLVESLIRLLEKC